MILSLTIRFRTLTSLCCFDVYIITYDVWCLTHTTGVTRATVPHATNNELSLVLIRELGNQRLVLAILKLPCVNMTGPAGINHVSAESCRFCSSLLYYNLITIYANTTKLFWRTTAEFIGLSSSIYRNGILYILRTKDTNKSVT